MIIKDQILDEHKNKLGLDMMTDVTLMFSFFFFFTTKTHWFVLSNPFSHIKLILVVLRLKLLNQSSAFTVFTDPTIIIV